MNQKILYIFICVVILFVACNDDDKLTPTETPEFGYFVPQGEHDYDQAIVEWNKKCNTFILYKYNLKELYWQVNAWQESQKQPENAAYPYSAGLVAEVADEEYVGLQLELIENSFLSFYRDTMLKRCIPLKLLLCSKMDWRDARGAMKLYNVYSGYDYLAFNWGSAEIVSMTTDQKKVFKVEANKLFLERLLDKKKIVVPSDFYVGSNYTDRITTTNMYSRGFLSRATKQEDDVNYYIEAIISTSYEDLNSEYNNVDSYKGVLNPIKDVNGLIRKKYDILVNYFKDEYGIDLQKIGDSVI